MRVFRSMLVVAWVGLTLPGALSAQPWPQVNPIPREERVVTALDALVAGLQPEAEAQWMQALTKAVANGKYRTLLRQIALPDDTKQYGAFRDYGDFHGATWKGIPDPTPGYWVYAEPYWYVWRDLAAQPKLDRRWGEEQATGKPNTEDLGDIATAWASSTPDGQAEWLLLEYATPIKPTGVKIYESFNPGAISRVTAFTLDGQEVELWKGTDPTRDLQNVGIFTIQFKANFQTNRIKLYINSPAVPGWNEIDAVGLVDTDKKVHWATAASASSTYGTTRAPPDDGQLAPLGGNLTPHIDVLGDITQHLDRLNEDVVKLKQDLKIDNEPNVDGVDTIDTTPPQVTPPTKLSIPQRLQRIQAEIARLKAEVAQLQRQRNPQLELRQRLDIF